MCEGAHLSGNAASLRVSSEGQAIKPHQSKNANGGRLKQKCGDEPGQPSLNALSPTTARKTAPMLNRPESIYNMTRARRGSAFPGVFYFADTKHIDASTGYQYAAASSHLFLCFLGGKPHQ
jgi:hypothetical protein